MPLADPHLLTVLKVQIQIGGAFQISTTYAATLHYQMAYRLQNCILDMLLPTSTDEALFLTVNAPHQASCVHVPRQISRPELLKLLPKYWVTQLMKKNHQKAAPVQSSNLVFRTKPDCAVEISFSKDTSSSPFHPIIFPSQIQMFVDSFTTGPLIKYFQSSGLQVYYFQHPETSHKYFDICDYDDYLEDCLLLNDGIPFHELNEFPKSQKPPPPKPIFSHSTCKPPSPYHHTPTTSPSSQTDRMLHVFFFPLLRLKKISPLEFHNPQEKTTHRHKIPNSTTILLDGNTKRVSAVEAAIN